MNFAVGDWFPLGEEASRRYALLRVVPIIPYEELICKEAMDLYNVSLKNGGLNYSAADLVSHFFTKLSFVRLIRLYEQNLWHLSSTLKRFLSTIRPIAQGTILCSRCKRDCGELSARR